MPRVMTRTKNRAGAKRSCGKCGREIMPGEKYRSWSFRYGGTRFRCARPECAPRPSDLTQSLMGEVYAAIESAQDGLPAAETLEDVTSAVEEVATAVEDVAGQYREAAEAFGGAGENADRADELDGWLSELQDFAPDEADVEEFDEDAATDEIRELSDAEGITFSEATERLRTEREGENATAVAEALSEAVSAAEELLGGCPL